MLCLAVLANLTVLICVSVCVCLLSILEYSFSFSGETAGSHCGLTEEGDLRIQEMTRTHKENARQPEQYRTINERTEDTYLYKKREYESEMADRCHDAMMATTIRDVRDMDMVE